MDDAIYEGSERLGLVIEADPRRVVAWPLRDARQGWQRPPTHGGRYDGGVNDAAAGARGAPVGADIVWPAVSGHANESRRFTRDNGNYREQTSVVVRRP